MTQLIKLLPILLTLPTLFSEELNFNNCLENEDFMEIPEVGRSAVHHQYLWHNATVYYEVDPEVEKSSKFVERFEIVKQIFGNKTCLKFVRRDPNDKLHPDYIHIKRGSRCTSVVGRRGGEQALTLSGYCYYIYVILHELMHAIGFHHEMGRTDRDEYVTVHYENVQKGERHNFRKYSKYEVNLLDTPFDYHSIMMYKSNFYSKNGKPTITPNNPKIKHLGALSSDLSPIDVLRINRYYECFGEKRPKMATRPEFFCNFEQYCNMFPLKSIFATDGWLILSGPRGNFTRDHTTGGATGHYAFYENRSNRSAEIRSKMFYTYGLQKACLSLYYHLYGKEKGSSWSAKISHSKKKFSVWSDLFEEGETVPGEWKEIRVDLTLPSDLFKLAFDASKVKPNISIAFDDITIYWVPCSEL